MNFESFVEHVYELMKEHLPEGWEKAEVTLVTADKINQQRKGINFSRTVGRCAPTVYMEELYENYKLGMKLDEVIEEICSILTEMDVAVKLDITKETLAEKNDLIIFQLLNTEGNQALLDTMPHREFQDLSIAYMWLLKHDHEGLATIPVGNDVAELFGLSEEQLFQLAYENTKRLLPTMVKPMAKMVNEICQNLDLEVLEDEVVERGGGFYVFTNEIKTFGATAMLYPEVFDRIAEMQGDDLYILPSSRHEVISIPKGELELEAVIEMVEMTNQMNKGVEDALSHQVYQYDRSTREITQATNIPFRPFGVETGEPNKEEVKERNTGR